MEHIAEKMGNAHRMEEMAHEQPNGIVVDVSALKMKMPTVRFNPVKWGMNFLGKKMKELASYMRANFEDTTSGDRIEQLKHEEAKVLELGGVKYGAYRDDKKNVHLVCSECTRPQCTLKWDAAEKSWTCLCRNSRFSFTGKLLSGAAKENLHYQKIKGADIFKS